MVFTGAEKLSPELAEAFEKRFGVRPVEGYGATELSPVVSGNVPPSRDLSGRQGLREGTVGRPLPGISAKVVDPDTGADLGADRPGMLLVTGPNVMKGYLGRPDLTAQVLRDGWYVTGDVARIDADGFIHITDRLSRFSKIGGEMVPHIRIEEAIRRRCCTSTRTRLRLAVAAVPDVEEGRAAGGPAHRPAGAAARNFAAAWRRAGCRRSGSLRPTVSARSRRFPCWGPASST